MSFTFTNYPILTPEQQNPMNALISRAMDTFGKGLKMSYAPRQIEADIFNKQIGPLATLATTPTFMNDQQFQENLRNVISSQFSNLGVQPSWAPTYKGQAEMDADEALKIAKKVTHAGVANTRLSGASAFLENLLGAPGKAIAHALTGGAITPELAEDENKLETILARMKKQSIDTHQLTQAEADKQYEQKKNETQAARVTRILRSNPALYRKNDGAQFEKNANALINPVASDISEESSSVGQTPSQIENAAKHFKTSPENIIGGLRAGVKSDEEMQDYIEGLKK
jgi:hypothetical protein